MDHSAHEPGTVDECSECRALAYEPGWYKALRDERVVRKRPDHVAIPEAGAPQVDPVVAETPDPSVPVPELEQIPSDDG